MVIDKAASKLLGVWYRDAAPPAWLRLLERPYRAWIGRRGGRPGGVPPVPVIVVGNLAAGGTGKTPLVIHLVELLARHGFTPGVISRGYGGRGGRKTLRVDTGTGAEIAGDEPVLIHARTGAPVWVDRKRVRALSAAVDAGVDVVISDDGLQHRALPRTLEICMLDGARRFGNGHLLPAGPLREPVERLESVDFVVCKGVGADIPGEYVMRLAPRALRRLSDGREFPPEHLSGHEVSAIAGIGFPDAFFNTLRELGCHVDPHPRPDHHFIGVRELDTLERPVVMTEKDAVKLPPGRELEDVWTLEVDAALPPAFDQALLAAIRSPGKVADRTRGGV